jgi:hypothetical protein
MLVLIGGGLLISLSLKAAPPQLRGDDSGLPSAKQVAQTKIGSGARVTQPEEHSVVSTRFAKARERFNDFYQNWYPLGNRRSVELRGLRLDLTRLASAPTEPKKQSAPRAPREVKGQDEGAIPSTRVETHVGPILPSSERKEKATQTGGETDHVPGVKHDTELPRMKIPTKTRPSAALPPELARDSAIRARVRNALKLLEPVEPEANFADVQHHLDRVWNELNRGFESAQPLPPVSKPTQPPL